MGRGGGLYLDISAGVPEFLVTQKVSRLTVALIWHVRPPSCRLCQSDCIL